MGTTVLERFSYSRLSTYKSCPYQYYLKYVKRHYPEGKTLATELGTLIHHIEQGISLDMMAGRAVDYDKWREELMSANVPPSQSARDGVYGLYTLMARYPDEYRAQDEKDGKSYALKCEWYKDEGILRQEAFAKAHPSWKIEGVEKYFEYVYNGKIMNGYIDRLWIDTAKDPKNPYAYIIDDIKTRGHPFADKDLTTPIQHVVYSMGVQHAYGLPFEPTTCFYDLPIIDLRQAAGTPGFIDRGKKTITKELACIDSQDFRPSPSPLCHWCPFSQTVEKRPTNPEDQNLCPFYSHWCKHGDKFDVENAWPLSDGGEPLPWSEETAQKIVDRFRQLHGVSVSNDVYGVQF